MNRSPARTCLANPSLALAKYWGKIQDPRPNLPATTSLALSLEGLESRTSARTIQEEEGSKTDQVLLNGQPESGEGIHRFFLALRKEVLGLAAKNPEAYLPNIQEAPWIWVANSENNFPTAAGIASSSSGFAALCGACIAAVMEKDWQEAWTAAIQRTISFPQAASPSLPPGSPGPEILSSLARIGSGSASRSIYGGFTRFRRGEGYAEQIAPADHWPELRVLLAQISKDRKEVSSRDAMNQSRHSSPYFEAWVEDAEKLAREIETSILTRDLEKLGQLSRLSYLRMFGTMISSDPPLVYWLPDSLKALRVCQELRNRGIGAWETMDAGPQVKILCLEQDLAEVDGALKAEIPGLETRACRVGQGLRWEAG